MTQTPIGQRYAIVDGFTHLILPLTSKVGAHATTGMVMPLLFTSSESGGIVAAGVRNGENRRHHDFRLKSSAREMVAPGKVMAQSAAIQING